jgi:DNA-binding transcriptional regulator YiaG
MATKTKAFINSALITWARETAGFSIPEASTRLGVTEAQLSSWEAGTLGPIYSMGAKRRLLVSDCERWIRTH